MNSLKRTIFLKISLLIFFILITLFSMNCGQLKIMNNFQINIKMICGIVFIIGIISSLRSLVLVISAKLEDWPKKIIFSGISIFSSIFCWYFYNPTQNEIVKYIILYCIIYLMLVFNIASLFSAFMDEVTYKINNY